MASLTKATDEEVLACPGPPLIKYTPSSCRPRSQSVLPQWLLIKDIVPSAATSGRALPVPTKPTSKISKARSRPILSFLKKKEEEHHMQLLSYRSV